MPLRTPSSAPSLLLRAGTRPQRARKGQHPQHPPSLSAPPSDRHRKSARAAPLACWTAPAPRHRKSNSPEVGGWGWVRVHAGSWSARRSWVVWRPPTLRLPAACTPPPTHLLVSDLVPRLQRRRQLGVRRRVRQAQLHLNLHRLRCRRPCCRRSAAAAVAAACCRCGRYCCRPMRCAAVGFLACACRGRGRGAGARVAWACIRRCAGRSGGRQQRSITRGGCRRAHDRKRASAP